MPTSLRSAIVRSRATCFVTSQTVSGHLTVLHGAPLDEPVADAGGTDPGAGI